METLDEFKKNNTDLPQFLKVLCILTFIGSGLGLLLGILLIVAFPIFQNLNVFKGFEALYIMLGIYTIVVNLGTLFGALLMWRKKVNGFYVYVFSQLLNIASPLVIYLIYDIKTEQNIVSYIFPLIFIAMYAANLKYLKDNGNN